MKKILFVIYLLTICNQIYGQKSLFDSLNINSTTKIIGRYPHYDESKTYEKYNFILEDSAAIRKFINKLKLNEEVPNSSEDPSFRLSVIDNYDEIGSWTIGPTLKSAMTHDGHTYKFDINQISTLYKENPFEYYYDKVVFTNKEEYNSYLEKQKNNTNFLFDYAPQFKYEGSFEIEFKKSNKFSNPKTISEYLRPLIEEFVGEDDYSLGYILNEKNFNNREQYTMTINGPKKLFKELVLKKHKNVNWEPTVEDGWFFYKK
jgi:hypothetical protein